MGIVHKNTTHFTSVSCFCEQLPCTDLTFQESYQQNSKTCPTIRLHVYKIYSFYTNHDIFTPYRKKCQLCSSVLALEPNTKIHTGKYFVMMETSISEFNTCFYIPKKQKLEFHLTHVHIIETDCCGNTRR